MFFAEDFDHVPLGFDNWLLNILFFVGIVVLFIHGWKLLQPKPAMDKQLRDLERVLVERLDGQEKDLMLRLDQQDEDSISRLSELRTHINTEVHRIHERIDSQGRELFTLKGFVDGWKERK